MSQIRKNVGAERRVRFAAILLTGAVFFIKTANLDYAYAGTTPPVTTATLTPSSPNGKNSWYVTPVRIDLAATDLVSGVKEINYRLNSGPWQKVSFSNSLNLAPNPSFETPDATSSGLQSWEATTVAPEILYSQDTTTFAPGHETASAKIIATEEAGSDWKGINNQAAFAVASYLQNMDAAVWIKTQNITAHAYYKIYAVSLDANGVPVYTLITQSSVLTGTRDWTRIATHFTVTTPGAIGVYLDIGLEGSGTVWVDAVSITASITSTSTQVTIGADGQHTFYYYSVDNAGNTETTRSRSFKVDVTPPGNWYDSGAFRGLLGSDHQLYVYTSVRDETSGISTLTDKYQYYTERNPTFGTYSILLSCSSTWEPNGWSILITPPFLPGVKEAYLLTPRTDFCNSNWRVCKIVRFQAHDMAGNIATKDFCINGPWIKLSGGGIVRSNHNIDMLSEPVEYNTDGLIETGGYMVEFFTSSKRWVAKNIPAPRDYTYDTYWNLIADKSQIAANANLPTTTGVFYVNGNFEVRNNNTPNNYKTARFDQIIFVNGNLRISRDLEVHNNSTALYIVKGDVEIDRQVQNLAVGIFADGTIHTAYNINENQPAGTLNIKGMFVTNKIDFQRTLQGTNNSNTPSEDFTYQPKYLIQTRQFFEGSTVTWINSN